MDWYKIFNLNDFDNLRVPDYSFEVELEDRGLQTYRICMGFKYSVIVDDIYLTPYLNDLNGFNKNERSAYIDSERNLWVGYAA